MVSASLWFTFHLKITGYKAKNCWTQFPLWFASVVWSEGHLDAWQDVHFVRNQQSCSSILAPVHPFASSLGLQQFLKMFLFSFYNKHRSFTLLCFCSSLQQKISIPRPEKSSQLQTFTFYLSNVGRDNPQGSFDCIQQYITRWKLLRLCIWDAIYLTKECVWALFNHPGCLQTKGYFCTGGNGGEGGVYLEPRVISEMFHSTNKCIELKPLK